MIKKARMETSLSGASVQKPCWNTFYLCEDFGVIRYRPSYIDKSLVIRNLFHTNGTDDTKNETFVVLATAPRKSGKSSNISMLQYFLEKPIDELSGAFSDKKNNILLFSGLNIMKPEHQDFRNMHFGKYTILKANFLCLMPITSVSDALTFYKTVIHNAYKQYCYLYNSEELENEQKSFCKKWIDEDKYQYFSDNLVHEGLKNLSEYLWIHYKKEQKIFVLIDDYDSAWIKAMPHVASVDRLKVILEHGIGMVANLVKRNNHVFGAFITGINNSAAQDFCDVLGPEEDSAYCHISTE